MFTSMKNNIVYWCSRLTKAQTPLGKRMRRTVYIKLKIMKIIFTNFMTKVMCLRKFCKTPAKDEGSVNHHLNTRGLDESSSLPPLLSPPNPPSRLFLCEERDLPLFASYAYVTFACRQCAQFSERLDGICLQSVHAYVHAFVTYPYKDMNFSWVDFHLLVFCTLLCADVINLYRFHNFSAHSENSLLSSNVTEVSSSSLSSSSSSSALQPWVYLGLLAKDVFKVTGSGCLAS